MGNFENSANYSRKGLELLQTRPNSRWRVPTMLWALYQDYEGAGRYDEALLWVDSLPEYILQTFIKSLILMQLGRYADAEVLLLKGLGTYWFSQIHYISWYGVLVDCAMQMSDSQKAWAYVQRGLQYGDDAYYAWGAIDMLLSALQLLMAEGHHLPAAKLASFIVHHPASSGAARGQASEYRATLESYLSADDFAAAWERGQQLDLGEVITEYMER